MPRPSHPSSSDHPNNWDIKLDIKNRNSSGSVQQVLQAFVNTVKKTWDSIKSWQFLG
jgi:hypothetical protein